MDEVLTIDELKTRYPDEHLLLVDFVNDEHGRVIAGRVLCHSKDREEMWRQAIELQPKPKHSAHVFTRTTPDKTIYML
jgi:hypothetical protein